MKNKKNPLGIKLGSDDMVFWRNIIDSRKLDIKTSENNLKYFKSILKMAEEEYKKAEAEFNKK